MKLQGELMRDDRVRNCKGRKEKLDKKYESETRERKRKTEMEK